MYRIYDKEWRKIIIIIWNIIGKLEKEHEKIKDKVIGLKT